MTTHKDVVTAVQQSWVGETR